MRRSLCVFGKDTASNLATAHLFDRHFDLVDPADHMALIDELANNGGFQYGKRERKYCNITLEEPVILPLPAQTVHPAASFLSSSTSTSVENYEPKSRRFPHYTLST